MGMRAHHSGGRDKFVFLDKNVGREHSLKSAGCERTRESAGVPRQTARADRPRERVRQREIKHKGAYAKNLHGEGKET
jgi:hypothetical protein